MSLLQTKTISLPLHNEGGDDMENAGERLREEMEKGEIIRPSPEEHIPEQSPLPIQQSLGGKYRLMLDNRNDPITYNNDGLMHDGPPKQRYVFWAIIISAIQIGVLILMIAKNGMASLSVNPMIGPNPEMLNNWGGKNTELILGGEYWRLVTSLFLHAGVIHLLANISVQIELGWYFEQDWGSLVWLIIYFASGIGGSIASVILMPSDVVSVGSSGAIMGLLGGKTIELILRYSFQYFFGMGNTIEEGPKQICTIGCSVIVVLLLSFVPFVDWAAHLGGFLTGVVVGLIVFACKFYFR